MSGVSFLSLRYKFSKKFFVSRFSYKLTNYKKDIRTMIDKDLTTNFYIRKATIEDAEKIHQIMLLTQQALEDKTLYVCDDLDYVKEHIEKQGFTVVACREDGNIIGSFLFRYPKIEEDNLGRDIGMKEDELERVVHMESAVVLQNFRGNHLQEKMLRFGETLIDKNQYHYFMATVSPKNPASYLTLEKCGYQLIKTKQKYGGLIRRIYQKQV